MNKLNSKELKPKNSLDKPKNLNKDLNLILMNRINGAIHHKMLCHMEFTAKAIMYHGMRDILHRNFDFYLCRTTDNCKPEEFMQ